MNDRLGFSPALYAMPPVRTPEIIVVDTGFPAPVRRLAARGVDLAVVLAAAAGVSGVIVLITGPGPAALAAIVLAAVLVTGFLYEAFCLAGWSLTLGKRVLGLRVVGADGAPVSTRTAVGRALEFPLGMSVAGLVPVLGQALWLLNAFSLVWDRPRRRCWHDRIAGTVVVGRAVVVRDGH
ncbi:RDD family protein [Actinomadura sp. 9N407]|uniref:RDD family protein n=1 Tax=Actinomadura sp. 9N407 TaxID=3375154 RepID=UPI0037B2007D